MAGRVPIALRDELASAFREAVCTRLGVAPFAHQREVWAATDGMVLTGPDPAGVTLLVPEEVATDEPVYGSRDVDGQTWVVVRRGTTPRIGGRAHIVSDLGAFKIGKSYGVALWGAGLAAVPGARVNLIGLEYDICEPEFTYLCEFLLSESGMGLKFDSLQNRPRDGKMWMDLPNGCRFEARSWERKDTLKGKEIDAYIYCEAYQLPGIECFTDFSQNLRARRGYAYFPTTPDRPWVKILHEHGHGSDPDWHCTCDVSGDANPFTFDPAAKERDRSLMTREKFEIHHNGRIGTFIGKVFAYERGYLQFTAESHPDLFKGGVTSRANLVIPHGWTVIGGADTGTFYSAVIVAFSPDGEAFVLEEFPNYRYVGQSPERDESLSIPQWAIRVTSRLASLDVRTPFWADPNSQFKGELTNYGIALLPAKAPVETRTEITREYFQHARVHLAPWLSVLPFELENAAWPEEASASGAFKRIKDRDHTLDGLEHVLARRPYGRLIKSDAPMTFAASQGLRKLQKGGNVHLGRM